MRSKAPIIATLEKSLSILDINTVGKIWMNWFTRHTLLQTVVGPDSFKDDRQRGLQRF